MPADDRVAIARVGAPHGVRGAVRVRLHATDAEALTAYGPLSTAGGRCLEVVAARPAKDGMIVSFAGVGDRDAAAALTGSDLFVGRAALPETDADEFYHADLIGLAVRDPQGQTVGTVVAVYNHGAGDMLEIAPPSGETLLMPFTRDVFPRVEPASGEIVFVRPAEIEARPGISGGDAKSTTDRQGEQP